MKKKTRAELQTFANNIQINLLGKPVVIRFDNHTGTDRYYLQVGMQRTCAYTGKEGMGWGGKAEVSQYATEDEFVKKVLGLAMAYAEHEVREGFEYKGKKVFNPHMSLDALLSVCKETRSREEE